MVRVAGNPNAFKNVTSSALLTRWLARRSYPCVVPAEVDPFLVAGRVVSLWRLLDVVDEPPVAGAELGELLRELHSQPTPPVELRQLVDPFESVAAAIHQHPDALIEGDLVWLNERVRQLRNTWAALSPVLPTGLIHGDAHTNNVMRLATGQAVLADWDHAAQGPREWDLIQVHYMACRFGRHGQEDLDRFTTAYGWDVRDWSGAETLLQIREITGLSPYIRKASTDRIAYREVSRRVGSLHKVDASVRWNSPNH
ncbi:phosphotransferase family protein [Actinomadura litoris]|uniref:phosphotransferase family protein n=1 Tax=Actinomadura litoris TaxID=2678616 RepID=UPI001FA7B98F|nr:phosphotransferase [Actinomadura litoris]